MGFAALRPVMAMLTKRHWIGEHNLPTEGGFILAPNHMSNFDPVSMGFFMAAHGYEIRFLAKAELFRVPLIGPFMKWWGMVPVVRQSSQATDSLVHAREALSKGDPVGIYFEGTLTRDPAFWAMKGKTGTARLALDTSVPIVPVVQWGAQDVMDRYSPKIRLRRTSMYICVLPPLDLSDIAADSSDHEAVREVTRRLQEALETGLSTLRNQIPPRTPWDPKAQGGPSKDQLKKLAAWRIHLAKAAKVQDVLPARPQLDRMRELTGEAESRD